MQGLFDNSLGMLLLAADYRSHTTGKMIKGLNTLYSEHLAYKAMLTEASTKPNVKPQEILALQNRASESKRALESKMELANAKIKQQFYQLDKQRGNHDIAKSGLKQIKEETPTVIKPLKGDGSNVITRESQPTSVAWRVSDKAISHAEMLEHAISRDALVRWEIKQIHELSEITLANLPEGIQSLTIENFTGITEDGKGTSVEKRVNIVTVDKAVLESKFGKGVDSAYAIPEITNKKGGTLTYDANWAKDNGSITIYSRYTLKMS